MLTRDTVEKVAQLARLKLTGAELDSIARDLSAVLANFQEIEKVNTRDIVPLVTPTDMTVHLRPDAVEASDSEKMIATAPEKSGRLFKVPPVV